MTIEKTALKFYNSYKFCFITETSHMNLNDPEQDSVKQEISDVEDDAGNGDNDDEDDDDDDDDDDENEDEDDEEYDEDDATSDKPARVYKRIGYENRYNDFVKWRESMNLKDANQSTMLNYFESLSEKFKPSTLWSLFSILKLRILEKENVDISTYEELNFFLKCISEGFKPKKSEIFTAKNISDFLHYAPDDTYLVYKVHISFN